MTCSSCGSDGAELYMMGLYKFLLCQSCAASGDHDGPTGLKPVRFADMERDRFNDGIADLVKAIFGSGR